MRTRVKTLTAALAVAATLATTGLAASTASAAEPNWTPLAPAAEPDANPLKGFIPFAGDYDNFPHSMEWSYFPLNAVMTGPDTFDWTVLDTALNDIASRGHQTAMRFYLDYPTKPSGIPQYLIDGGLVTHSYDEFNNNGVSVSPNYDDPALRSALDSFISALGQRYNGDPRIGFLQAGLVGFWGEWHTWPYNGDGHPNWMPSSATQSQILNDFVTAFPDTQLEVRKPNSDNANLPIGYHDDSFALETKKSTLGWHFMDNMIAAGTQDKWQQYSIGGELRPELQGCIFSSTGCTQSEDGGDYDFYGSVAQTHVSWMINHYAFATGYSDSDKAAAIAAAKSIGYSFRVTDTLVPTETVAGQTTIGAEIANIGVAPFYYDWPISLAVIDASGATVHTQTTDWHVSDIPAGSSKQFTAALDAGDLPAGQYRLALQVTNPLAGGMPIRFANAAQDADVDGWLTFGTTSVAAAGVTPPTDGSTPPSGAGTGTQPGGTAVPAAAGSVRTGSLAATGADTQSAVVLTLVGMITLIGGALVLVRARRRAAN